MASCTLPLEGHPGHRHPDLNLHGGASSGTSMKEETFARAVSVLWVVKEAYPQSRLLFEGAPLHRFVALSACLVTLGSRLVPISMSLSGLISQDSPLAAGRMPSLASCRVVSRRGVARCSHRR